MSLSKGTVYKYDLKGNFIQEYESAECAADINGISSSVLVSHIKGKWSYCKNHIYTRKYYIKLPQELLEHKTKRIYKTKKIYQYDIDGNFLNEYEDKNEASIKTGLKPKYISNFASGNLGKAKTYGGFLWSYEKKNKIPKIEKNRQFKKIHQYSKDGKFIKTYNSLKEAAKKFNVTSGGISTCASGIKGNPSCGGYIWKYEKLKSVTKIIPRKKQIKVYKNKKLFKIYESVTQVHKELKLSRRKIWECLSGKINSANDYVLKYKDKK